MYVVQQCSASTSSPKQIEILFVEPIECDLRWRPAILFGGFEEHGEIAEAWIVDEPSKGFDADAALTDVLVAIDAAAERPLRVVQVEHLQAIDADETLELLERRPRSLRATRCRSPTPAGDRCRGRHRYGDRMSGARRGRTRAVRRLFRVDVPCPAVCSSRIIVLPRRRALEKVAQAVGDQVEARAFAPGGVAAGVQHDAIAGRALRRARARRPSRRPIGATALRSVEARLIR